MAGLADYLPESATVEMGKLKVELWPFSIRDISTLLRLHAPDLDALYSLFLQARRNWMDENAPARIVADILMQAPAVAAHIIAISAREENADDNIQQLPFPVQFTLLSKIFEITFNDFGGPAPFFTTLTTLLEGLGLAIAGAAGSTTA